MRYYICEICGELATDETIDEEMSYGGMPYCGCQYIKSFWDTELKCFEPEHLRQYVDWTEIPANIFNELRCEKNTVRRLWMFESIPKIDRTV